MHRALERPILSLTLAVALVLGWESDVLAQGYQYFFVPKGQSITVFNGINVVGTVYLSIKSKGPEHCLDVWQIRVGLVTEEGRKCGYTAIRYDYPLIIWGEIRVGGGKEDSVVALTANVAVSSYFGVIDVGTPGYEDNLCKIEAVRRAVPILDRVC
jgi:hypothetical protein